MKIVASIALSIASLALVTLCSPACAQATRTWVSGVGDDVNPCSRTAPCKTFAGAISKTATTGTINCLDPAGYGAVTITKSITIDCTGTNGSILAPSTNAVTVNGAGIVVHLRGLSIEGAGAGLVGVNFINGATLTIEKCEIFGFTGGAATGISFAPTANAELFVADTAVGSNGSGVGIRPVGAANARVTFKNINVFANNTGISAQGGGSTGFIRASVADSVIQGNAATGVAGAAQSGQAFIWMFLSGTLVVNNGAEGVSFDGGQAAALLDQSTVFSNNIGLKTANGGQIITFSSNKLIDNISTDGAFTGTLQPK